MEKETVALNKNITDQVIKIILDHKGAEKIAVYGSRASKDFKETSDIDIAIFGKDWSDKDINLVKHELEEQVKTPLKFDVVNFYCIVKEKLKQNILENGKVIYGA